MRIFQVFSLLAVAAVPGLGDGSWVLTKGNLRYVVTHSFKTVEGESTEVKGKGKCLKGECSFLVAVPVASFGSGNDSRDTHMLETMKAAIHPLVKLEVKFSANQRGPLKGRLTVGEITEDVEVAFQPKWDGERAFELKTDVPFRLSRFHLEAPSLLGIAVNDLVPVTANLRFQRD